MIDQGDEEQILGRFRRWLQEARAEAAEGDHPGGMVFEPNAEIREIGLYQLVEEFTALRHEIKLQTRGARSLQEQTESIVGAMQQAIDQFRSVSPKEAQAAWSVGKGLAEALAELDVALERGRVEIDRATRRLLNEPAQALQAALDALYARQPWLSRRLVRSYHEQVKGVAQGEGQTLSRELLGALAEGYSLIQVRLARMMKAEQIQPIACVGLPVDTGLMTVVDVVDAPGTPPGVVVEEIRRGYNWQGRLLRYAEVRASRSAVV
jgi:molecular chaperone GrpE